MTDGRSPDHPDRVRRRHGSILQAARRRERARRSVAAGTRNAIAAAAREHRADQRVHAALSRALDDELFGYFARPVPRGTFATLVRLLTGCADVRAAFDAMTRFYRLFDRHAYLKLAIDRRHATLVLDPRDREQARSIFFVHSMLLAPWRTAAWLAGRPIPLDAITLPPRFRAFAGETRYLSGARRRSYNVRRA